MNEVLGYLNGAFNDGGFMVFGNEEWGYEMHKYSTFMIAVPKLKKLEPCKCVTGRGTHLGTETRVTASVSCYGKECGFLDEVPLREKVARSGELLLQRLGGGCRWKTTGELTRDTATGRLCITVTVELVCYEETEADSE